jgi:hypothetical protein
MTKEDLAMAVYLLSVYQPDGPAPPAAMLAEIMQEVDALNQEIKDAGAWVFAGGLEPPETAAVLRRAGEEVLATDGPYAEGKEHLGGFTIVDAPDRGTAMAWGRKLTRATGLPVEVRPFGQLG